MCPSLLAPGAYERACALVLNRETGQSSGCVCPRPRRQGPASTFHTTYVWPCRAHRTPLTDCRAQAGASSALRPPYHACPMGHSLVSENYQKPIAGSGINRRPPLPSPGTESGYTRRPTALRPQARAEGPREMGLLAAVERNAGAPPKGRDTGECRYAAAPANAARCTRDLQVGVRVTTPPHLTPTALGIASGAHAVA